MYSVWMHHCDVSWLLLDCTFY